ncbi:septal ring lytic transglycosylase RlpA family protein [Acidisphaera sp. L21]|uniref:septal ring lytic transglycosylase RlpA family protein n=1 Tax=Acidisphaera sp. L21 TaxID=1641851 RepID=UPI00131C3C91|nr:septal ring lytic transglycosylase RlpA family protein [Acidisphaera sp. L21]
MLSHRLLISALAFTALLPAAAMAETVGVASWYGGQHDGRRTSSGEVFDQEGLTAASRSIPLGTLVRVTMAETGQSVVVKVNDRMGGRGAIIDLSKGAARQIGLLGRGRGMVSIASAANEPLEVAEATEDEAADMPETDAPRAHRRGSHSRRSVVASRRSHGGASVTLVHQTMQHHTVRRRRV